MLDSKLFINAIKQLNQERNIPTETLQEALAEAFVKTYHKEFDPEAELRVEVDFEKGILKLIHIMKIVDKIEDELTEILLEDAQKKDKNFKVGDKYEYEVEFNEKFSALAALQVKQILRQKIREKEKDIVLNEYSGRIGQIVDGVIEKVKSNFFIVAFDKTLGFLPKNEVNRSLELAEGDRIKAVIARIDQNSNGLPVVLSMTSPQIIKSYLEEEVPEVKDKTVKIEAIARFDGIRTKLIVSSENPGVDPVGTIVGPGGERIKRIIEKANGEFIDVIPKIEDGLKQIARAFVPAKPIFIKDDGEEATVVVKDEDFSIAIGKGGSNAKVVARLLNKKINVEKESETSQTLPSVNQDLGLENRKRTTPINIDASQFMVDDSFVKDELFDDGTNYKVDDEPDFKLPENDHKINKDHFSIDDEEDELFD